MCPSLSIPLWFDWGVTTFPPAPASATLSIPLWFDWGLALVPVVRHRRGPFNPTLVRLDPGRHLAGPRSHPPFNPTLVRLDPGPVHDNGAASSAFQSHFGSIGPQRRGQHHHAHPHFQSHFGSIGPPPSSRWPAGSWRLSIPLWFDWTFGIRRRQWRERRLSIPLWFDWTQGEAGLLHIP